MDHFCVQPYGHPLTKQTYKLTIGDIYSPKIWIRQAYFFPYRPHTTSERCYEVLREGLKRAVTDMPRAAGILRKGASNDPRDMNIEVDEEAHAVLEFADLTNDDMIPPYSDMQGKGFPMDFELGVRLLPAEAFCPVGDGSPQIIGRLSVLDGGLCLATAASHVTCDAGSLATLETIWAKHTADASASRPYRSLWNHPPKPEEVEFLSTPKPGAAEMEDDSMMVVPAAVSPIQLPAPPPSKEAAIDAQRQARLSNAEDPDTDYRWAIYRFSPESLRRLRKIATRSDAPQPTSRVAALGALMWSRVSYIKQQSKEGEDVSRLYFPINIRHRLKPAIDPNFIANVVDVVPSELPLEDLEKNDEYSLVKAADEISRAVRSWSQPRWESYMNTVTRLPPDQAFCPNPIMMLGAPNVIFNDYSRSATNILDWGSDLGVVDRARYPRPPQGPATAIRVHPQLPDGSLEASVAALGPLLEALAKDEVFSQYGELACYPA